MGACDLWWLNRPHRPISQSPCLRQYYNNVHQDVHDNDQNNNRNNDRNKIRSGKVCHGHA